MIQDIGPKVYDNTFCDRQPEADERILVYDGGKTLLRYDEQGWVVFPTAADFEGHEISYTYLFSIDDRAYFLGETTHVPEGFIFEPISVYRTSRPRGRSFAGVTGHSLYEWYEAHRFCGRCGAKTERDRRERMVKCPDCGRMFYPRISPAVIVAVLHDGKLLMSKYAGGAYRKFALLAGFNEIGETLEETVHREVFEEVGIRVKNLRYYKSQPWPFTNSLLMGFFCDLDGDDETLTIQEDELAEAGWYPPEEVPEDEEKIALTREMMTRFKEGTYPR